MLDKRLGAAAVVAGSECPHANREWLRLARRDPLGETRRPGLAPLEQTANHEVSWITPFSVPFFEMKHGLTSTDEEQPEIGRVCTDDAVFIPTKNPEFMEVFSQTKVESLTPHWSIDQEIDLELGCKIPYGWIYNIPEFKPKSLIAYMETHVANRFIQQSPSLAAALILLAKKQDRGLRLCVDYQALNLETIMNKYPWAHILERFERLSPALIFNKLDLRNGYHLIRIAEGDGYVTAVKTLYGRFKYRVMHFSLPHTPSLFQSYIDDCMQAYIDNGAVSHHDDILIHSTDEKENNQQVQTVLERLREFGLYCKAKNWQFRVLEVSIAGFVINSEWVRMESDWILTIEDWLTPKSAQDIQLILGFANFDQRFFQIYAKITLQLTELLRKVEAAHHLWASEGPLRKRQKSELEKRQEGALRPALKWEWTWEAGLAFQKLKKAFTKALILQLLDPAKSIILQTDASCFAITGILNQYNGFGNLLPVNFYTQKCSPAKLNNNMCNWKRPAIREIMNQWWHYLHGANHKVLIQCNHRKLEYFQSSNALLPRQARWAEILSSSNFIMKHLERNNNLADGPSNRPDFDIGYEIPTTWLLATLAATTVELYNDLLPAISTAQATDSPAINVNNTIVNTPMVGIPDVSETSGQDASTDSEKGEFKVISEAVTYEGRMSAPTDDRLCSKGISLFHDYPKSGHFGALRTIELILGNCY